MGEITNTTIKVDKVMENAFGGTVVDSSTRHEREWIVTWAQPNPYVFDTAETITKAELQKVLSDRNVYLEEQKAATKKYYAERNTTASAISSGTSFVLLILYVIGIFPQCIIFWLYVPCCI